MIVTFVTKILSPFSQHFVHLSPFLFFSIILKPLNKISTATRGSFLKIGHKLNMALFIVCENSRLLIGQFVKVVSHPRLTLVKGGRVEA